MSTSDGRSYSAEWCARTIQIVEQLIRENRALHSGTNARGGTALRPLHATVQAQSLLNDLRTSLERLQKHEADPIKFMVAQSQCALPSTLTVVVHQADDDVHTDWISWAIEPDILSGGEDQPEALERLADALRAVNKAEKKLAGGNLRPYAIQKDRQRWVEHQEAILEELDDVISMSATTDEHMMMLMHALGVITHCLYTRCEPSESLRGKIDALDQVLIRRRAVQQAQAEAQAKERS